MKLLLTGGLGYLGGRLARHLVPQSGYEVILGTRRDTGPVVGLTGAQAAQMTWDSSRALQEICQGVDAIVHLAGMNAQECAARPVEAYEFNVAATARLVQAAIQRGVRRFVYVSTAHVYNSPLAGTITEETCPVSPHPYAASHRAAEDIVRFAARQGDLEGVVIRLSNAYGAPASKDANCWMLLINDLCRQAVTTRRMVLQSTGLQRRDFVPLAEVCRAIQHLLELPAQNLVSDVFNVGGQWAPTLWEVACLLQERCQQSLGFEPGLERAAPQEGETSGELEYRIDCLQKTGFQLNPDKMGEIDHLFKFCQTAFK